MYHVSTTPFGRRPITADLIEAQIEPNASLAALEVDKYALLDDLRVARSSYNLSDRDLLVLATLLSYHAGRTLASGDDLVVFPSNKNLSERAHGMAESTLRRHLAALVSSGLIRRNDSPNGKRYAARDARGTIVRAFGFDLKPLLARATRISDHACVARDAALDMRRLREDIILMNRDATKLIAYAKPEGVHQNWEQLSARTDTIRQALRRKNKSTVLETLRAEAHDILTQVTTLIEPITSAKMSGTDVQNERHNQNSNIELLEPKTLGLVSHCNEREDSPKTPRAEHRQAAPQLPLALILKACPDVQPYAKDGEIRHWHQLVATAQQLHRMMGISSKVWEKAQHVMGPETAAITLGGILQRITEIRSPAAYLKALTTRAEVKGFSPGPMIMALLNAPSNISHA